MYICVILLHLRLEQSVRFVRLSNSHESDMTDDRSAKVSGVSLRGLFMFITVWLLRISIEIHYDPRGL